jgi:hypothetical protein
MAWSREHKIELVYNIVPQATQTDIINITTKTNKQEIALPEVCTQKKVFVGPHFWLTKHYLNRVIESGVLHFDCQSFHKFSYSISSPSNLINGCCIPNRPEA